MAASWVTTDVVEIGGTELRPMIRHLSLAEPFEGRAHLLTEVDLIVGGGDRHLGTAEQRVIPQLGDALLHTAGIRAHIREGVG